MRMVNYNKESPLKVGQWYGEKKSSWLAEVITLGEKRIGLREYGSESSYRKERGVLEDKLVAAEITTIKPGSTGWNRRAAYYRKAALLGLAKTMTRYELKTVMILKESFLPQPAAIAMGIDGETYSVLFGKE